jgi:hypothetical protein
MDSVDVTGASGAVYRFTRFRVGHPLSAMGGNVLYTRPGKGGAEIVYAGEVQNLLTDANRHWETAVRDFGARELYTRLNISETIRRRENADLLASLRPPMNAIGDPSPGQGGS